MKQTGMDSLAASKLSILQKWAAQHMGDIRHERRVASVATSLVNATLPLHSLTRADLRMLKMAAIVHDVGRSVNHKRHPAIGAKMILKDDSLPLKKRQRRALAYLTLHHRGAVPAEDSDSILRSGDDAGMLRMLLAFLRAADALDSRWMTAPALGFSLRGRRLRISCRLREDHPKAPEIFSRRKKFRLLEEMLGCKIEVSIESNRRLRLVA